MPIAAYCRRQERRGKGCKAARLQGVQSRRVAGLGRVLAWAWGLKAFWGLGLEGRVLGSAGHEGLEGRRLGGLGIGLLGASCLRGQGAWGLGKGAMMPFGE